MHNRIKTLENMIEFHSMEGSYTYNAYMHGIANGLILAHSIMTETKPKFLKEPNVWLKDQLIEEIAKEQKQKIKELDRLIEKRKFESYIDG